MPDFDPGRTGRPIPEHPLIRTGTLPAASNVTARTADRSRPARQRPRRGRLLAHLLALALMSATFAGLAALLRWAGQASTLPPTVKTGTMITMWSATSSATVLAMTLIAAILVRRGKSAAALTFAVLLARLHTAAALVTTLVLLPTAPATALVALASTISAAFALLLALSACDATDRYQAAIAAWRHRPARPRPAAAAAYPLQVLPPGNGRRPVTRRPPPHRGDPGR